jgi:hypothetical protein
MCVIVESEAATVPDWQICEWDPPVHCARLEVLIRKHRPVPELNLSSQFNTAISPYEALIMIEAHILCFLSWPSFASEINYCGKEHCTPKAIKKLLAAPFYLFFCLV